MSPAPFPAAGRAPRRARYLVPRDLPRRNELIAAAGLLVVAAHLLFAPLTIVLAAAFHAVGRLGRFSPRLLWAPAVAGLAWALATGPATAAAGFAARPRAMAAVLAGLGPGPGGPDRLAASLSPLRWLPGQLPLALIAAAGEAAAAWWLWWLGTDEWRLPPARPGLAAAARRWWNAAAMLAGGVVTREGACLGVDRATGRPVGVSWREAEAGVLVTGESWPAAAGAGWQLAHAAIRRRKPVIAVDLAGDPALAARLAAACAAAQAPLQVFGAGGTGYYEPFQAGSPARKAALVAAMLDWAGTPAASRQALAAVLADVFAVAAAAPAGPQVPVPDDVAGLLGAASLRARLDRVPAYHPRRAELADRVAASAARLDAEPGAAALAARQLASLRASRLGCWLCPGAPAGASAGSRISLAGVIRDRGVALFPLAAPGGPAGQAAGPGAARDRAAEMIASLVAMDIAGTCADLRRAGVAGDGLAWFGGCEGVPAAVLAGLPAVGAQAGLGCVFVTTSAPVACELARQAGVLVVHRLADRGLAAQVAARTGTRLVPADAGQLPPPAPAAGMPPGPGMPVPAAGFPAAGFPAAGFPAAGLPAAGLPAATGLPVPAAGQPSSVLAPSAGGLAPSAGGPPAVADPALTAPGATGTPPWPGPAAAPWTAAAAPGVPFGAALAPVIPADVLGRLGNGEFSLVVGGLPDRVVPRARSVAGRVPRYRPVRPGRLARLDRATGTLPAGAAAQPAPEQARPAPGQPQPSPGQARSVPGQGWPSPGPEQQAPGQAQPAPGQGWPAPGEPQPSPGQARSVPGQGWPSPGRGQQAPGQAQPAPGRDQP